MTLNLCVRYQLDLGALIAEAMFLGKSIELRFTVPETISCKFQSPIGQRRIATPKDKTLYQLEIYQLQLQMRREFSTPLRLREAETIPSWFQANRLGVALAPKSAEVNWNKSIIWELEGY